MDEVVVDKGNGIVLRDRPISHRDMNHKNNGITPGFTFESLLEFKVWIKEFSVRHHRSYTVVHSDVKKPYMVKCEDGGCSCVVRARLLKGGPTWKITSFVATHIC
jgi:hypothetical protein